MNRMEMIVSALNDRVTRGRIMRIFNGELRWIGDCIESGGAQIMNDGAIVLIRDQDFTLHKNDYAPAPQTITTKSVEIPKPISALPESGFVFRPNASTYHLYDEILMSGVDSGWLSMLLKRGRLHLTAEAAIAQSKADIEAAGGVWE